MSPNLDQEVYIYVHVCMFVCIHILYITYISIFSDSLPYPYPTRCIFLVQGGPCLSDLILCSFLLCCFMPALLFPHCLFLAFSTPGPWHTSGLLILPYLDWCWSLFSWNHQSLSKGGFLWLLYHKQLSLPLPLPTLLSFLYLALDICSIYYLFIVRPEHQLCEDRSSPISPAPCVAYSIDRNKPNREQRRKKK